jgi:hypothetical protein
LNARKYRRIFEPHEDERPRKLVDQFGAEDWVYIAARMRNRTARQCRERFKTYLCPGVNVAPWTEAEDKLLLEKYDQLRTKWVDFRQFFPHRTVNNIKNRWHTLSRRLRHQKAESRTPREDGSAPAPSTEQKVEDPLAVSNIANWLNPPICC